MLVNNLLSTSQLPLSVLNARDIEPSIDLSVDSSSIDSQILGDDDFSKLFDDDEIFKRYGLDETSSDSSALDPVQEFLNSGFDMLLDENLDSILMQTNGNSSKNVVDSPLYLPVIPANNPAKTTPRDVPEPKWTKFGNQKVMKYTEEYHRRRLENNRAVQRTRRKAKEQEKATKLKMAMLTDENQKLASRVEQMMKEMQDLKSTCEALKQGSSVNIA